MINIITPMIWIEGMVIEGISFLLEKLIFLFNEVESLFSIFTGGNVTVVLNAATLLVISDLIVEGRYPVL